jgi:hypothetical protein
MLGSHPRDFGKLAWRLIDCRAYGGDGIIVITVIGHKMRGCLLIACLAGLALLSSFAGNAWAFTEPGITGHWTDFANCPVNLIASAESSKCLHSYVIGGSVQVGHSNVPISVPGDTFDLGVGGEEGEGVAVCAPFGGTECTVTPSHGLFNGPAQPVPGGLLGAVGNTQITGVLAKLEWAVNVPPGTAFGRTSGCLNADPLAIFNLCKLQSAQAGTALTLEAKIHLMSPFLGPSCYIGSAASPIVIPLTTGFTSPPAPAHPIHGNPDVEIINRPGALQVLGTTLVNNSFSVPVATGCGTSGGGLINSSINHKLGLPSPPGQNTIVIIANAEERAAIEVLTHGWTGE